MYKMSFGRKMLEKYGWKEGMGLGKNESGVKRPISVHMKNDTTGLGYNEFSNWWESLYNNTIKKIPTHSKEGEVETLRPKKIMKISKDNAKHVRCVSETDSSSSEEDIPPPRLTGKLRRIVEADAKYLENLKKMST